MLGVVCDIYCLPPCCDSLGSVPTPESISVAARIVPSVIEKVRLLLREASGAFAAIERQVPVVENDAGITTIDNAVSACVRALYANGANEGSESTKNNVELALEKNEPNAPEWVEQGNRVSSP